MWVASPAGEGRRRRRQLKPTKERMNQGQQSSDGNHDGDASLSDFLASVMIPDELVEHFLANSGFQCPDVRLHCKARRTAVVKDKREKQQKDKRLILTMEDLLKALQEYGVNVKHQEYFADSPSTGMDPASGDDQ